MTTDRSLDEFAASDTDEEAVDTGAETETERDDDGDVTPATPTSTWNADGAGCERCGETAVRRWRDDGSLVCADCKEW